MGNKPLVQKSKVVWWLQPMVSYNDCEKPLLSYPKGGKALSATVIATDRD
jgi:hypothetical protein